MAPIKEPLDVPEAAARASALAAMAGAATKPMRWNVMTVESEVKSLNLPPQQLHRFLRSRSRSSNILEKNSWYLSQKSGKKV